jgi:hypothetical protein
LELTVEIESFGAGRLTPTEQGKDAAINPANSVGEKMSEAREARTRIPMSAPRAKLSTPDIPGFHSHWLNDYPGRLLQASQGGYEFVSPEEALVSSRDLAGDVVGKGTDLGSRISVVVGKNEDGTPLRAYLMKIRNEWYKEDQLASQERVDAVHEGMRQGKQQVDGEGVADARQRYVKSAKMQSTYSRRG